MNAHDSERIKGMLEELGLGEAPRLEDADLIVFNTCTIREKAESRLAAHLGLAKALKDADPGRLLAVGGCFAEVQREHLFEQFPQVDFAFGPGSIAELGEWLKAERNGARGSFGSGGERRFAAELPFRRERPFQAWVQVSMGCNSVCSYCIVPTVRGKQISRPAEKVLAEVRALAADGVREITLLGQNVNSYGRDLPAAERVTFAELLRSCDRVDGVERIRFTSPHPKDFRSDLIAAMAECESVCEHAHLPAQSGSSRILKAMRRTYDRERFLSLAAEMRERIPDLVPEDVKRERIERLIELVQSIAGERNRARIGSTEQVLVEGPSRTDETLLRGRTRRNTTVNFAGTAKAGELAEVRVENATSTTLRGAQVVSSPA